MKKALIKTISIFTSLALSGAFVNVSASAEIIAQDTSEGYEMLFCVNASPSECEEYKLFPCNFWYDEKDYEYVKDNFTDPSAKTCVEYNIYPNKYNIVPPHYVSGALLTENNGYYKYLSDKGYANGTVEVKPGVYPSKKGVCYEASKRMSGTVYPDEIMYLTLPLDAEDIPKAEAFIEADDREGLYDFLADINAYQDPYLGEQNEFTQYINRDYTSVYDNLLPLCNYTPDEMYQYVIDNFVYPKFKSMPNAVGGCAPSVELEYDLVIGDSNIDGKISVQDVILVNKMAVGSVDSSNSVKRYLSDADASGEIDMTDVNLIMQYLVNIIDEFPAVY